MAASGGRSVADTSFEFRLERMYAEAPSMGDADLFTLQVLERLDRGWAARRLVIGFMGALGGLIGGYEILGSGALGQMAVAVGRSNDFLTQHVASALTSRLGPAGLYIDPQAIWLAAALAVVAAGVGVARLFREI
jgi:hypothetical protein